MRCRTLGWLVCATLLVPGGALGAQAALRVVVTGIRADQGGEVLVTLYDRESAWLTVDSALAVRRIVPDADSALVEFEGLTPDARYAVAVVHDRNGNGKMDMRWLPWPKPKEGAGVSNNHVRAGKPRYAEATFPATGPLTVERIIMRY